MKKLKVMFMCNSFYGGGAERVLQTILSNIDYSRFDVTLYTLHQTQLPPKLRGKVTLRHIYSHCLGGKSTRLKGLFFKLNNKFKLIVYNRLSAKMFYRLFVRGKYDIEVAFIEGYSTRVISGSTNPKSKKLTWAHIDMLENHWSSIAYKNEEEEKACYSKFNVVACVSEVVRHSMDSLFDLKTTKVVYNPVNEELILEKAKEELRECKKSDTFRFISLGRLEEQKGYDRLIPIIANLRSEGLNVELWIFGQGSHYGKLHKMINAFALEDYVMLWGFKSNPYAYFKYCDVFVCSSRNEGYSTAVTEALILGLPVVSTLCSGTTELLGENSEYGIVTENNTEALYQGMKKIMEKDCLEKYKKKSLVRGSSFNLKELMSAFEKEISF